jgi:DNA mismatch repair protein MutH
MQFNALPCNEQELLERCRQLAGKSLVELASSYKQTLPKSFLHAKGWVGQFIESLLGVIANNLPEPDFKDLGIELKTIPINLKGQPQESTFICTASISELQKETFETSRVWQKLKKILFVPVEADPKISIENRKVGNAILWSPDLTTRNILQKDWEELSEMLVLGKQSVLSARFGTYLQIRPKAAHSRILQVSLDEEGNKELMGPKGFYLRSRLTKKIIEEFYFTPNH